MLKALALGRLTKDPELKYTPAGKAVCTLRLACDQGFGQDAESEFIDVVLWEKQAESAANYLQKGRRIFAEGRLQSREWDAQNGKRREWEIVATEVRYLDRPQGQQQGGQS